MKNILRIDASARPGASESSAHISISKRIADEFILSIDASTAITYRDVGAEPPPFIHREWVAAAFTAEAERTTEQASLLSLSDSYIDELMAADTIVIAAPMYNYGMPATLKAWFDQVIRVNKTFTFDLSRGDFPLAPILAGKTLVLITSVGEFGFEMGGVRQGLDHLNPHIRTLSRYLGVENIHEIRAEYQEFNDQRHRESVDAALKEAKRLGQQLKHS